MKVTSITVTAACVVRLGEEDEGPLLRLEPVPAGPGRARAGGLEALPSVDRRPTAVMPIPAAAVRIGRDQRSDVVVSDLNVSRRHAELRKSAAGTFEIVDLGSHNGTFVNGARVDRAVVGPDDIIAIGHATFRLADGELREYVDTGDVPFEARNLRVVVGGKKVLIEDMSFPIPGKSFVAIAGPAGSGKSTLLNALVGMRPANSGSVLYDHRDLYSDYAELRHRIGLVPQQDVTHTQLTTRSALGYSAELRFPADTKRHERRQRIEEVLTDLDMSEHRDTRFEKLSGGQRKRACIATELLTQPSMLFLDEPTSPLDAYHKRDFMQQLRRITDEGRSVVVITHDIEQVSICDRLLVLAPGGRMAFYGPPAEGLRYFGCADWADVFRDLETRPDEEWSEKFKASPAYELYVAAPLSARPPGPVKSVRSARPARSARSARSREPSGGPGSAPERPELPRPRGKLRQTVTLSRRYARVIAADRGYLLFTVLLPVILGGLARVMPAPEGLAGTAHTNVDAVTLLLVLVMSACLAGTANSVREIVKELEIFRRERAAGLSSGSYVASKVVVLGVVSVVQALIITLIGLPGRPMPDRGAILPGNPLLEVLIGVCLLSFVSMCVGLVVSSIVSTSEKTMPALVVLTMVQVVLSGGIFPLVGRMGLDQVSWIAPARWGMAALGATANLNVISPSGLRPDPLWAQSAASWEEDIAILLGIGLVCLVVAWRRMHRLSPGRR
jgi:ABC-type multidrug transport system ATPase subunit